MRTSAIALLVASFVAASAHGDSVVRDGVEIHYTIVGDHGPYAVILSGGPGEEISSMDEVAAHLRDRFRCVMLEQRGTGRSMPPKRETSTFNLSAYIEDIEAVRLHLGGEKVVVVGNSWGMMLALAYGGAHPDAALAIVTLGSGPISRDYLTEFVDNQRRLLTPADREVVEFWSSPDEVKRDPDRAAFERIRATAPAYFYDRKAAMKFASELKPSDFHPEIPSLFLTAEPNFDLRPLLRKITAPTLLLQGRQDLAGEANVSEAHELIRNSVVTLIHKCGHMPWVEKGEETWRVTDEFLGRVAGSGLTPSPRR